MESEEWTEGEGTVLGLHSLVQTHQPVPPFSDLHQAGGLSGGQVNSSVRVRFSGTPRPQVQLKAETVKNAPTSPTQSAWEHRTGPLLAE